MRDWKSARFCTNETVAPQRDREGERRERDVRLCDDVSLEVSAVLHRPTGAKERHTRQGHMVKGLHF